MARYNIIETFPGKEDFHLFSRLPESVYTDNIRQKYRLHQLTEEYLHTCLVVLCNALPVARLALYFNPHLKHNGKNTACIGAYECEENEEICNLLLRHAMQMSRGSGYEYLIGPMSGSTWHDYRFNDDNICPLFFGEAYHHLYYSRQFKNAGFEPISRYYSGIEQEMNYTGSEFLTDRSGFEERGITFRSIDLAHYEEELDRLYDFCSEVFSNNFLYTPVSKLSFQNKYLPLKEYIDPGYVRLAEHKGQLVGMIFCLQDFYNTGSKSLVVKTLARKNDQCYSGLGAVLADEVIRQAKKNGSRSIIHALMKEDNASVRSSTGFQGKPFKTYTLYGIGL